MENRNFQLDTEWNVVHYPYQPTGFGILIIGDEKNFVEKDNSFWVQNEGKLSLINQLKDSGYTIFYSNLYGKNWGSDKAVMLAKQLYDYMIRHEILNDKIHLLAEGMGTLVALKLVKKMKHKFRSVVLINPIYSLKKQLEHEKDHKFFYKKLLREVSEAYELDFKEVENHFSQLDDLPEFAADCPIKIIHILAGNRTYKQSEVSVQVASKWEKEGISVSISYMLPEKKAQLDTNLIKFLKRNEQNL
jgi:pimeloyl-ACP methyl ester carboxylesterase